VTFQPPPELDAESARLSSLRRMLSIGGPTTDDYVRTVRLARQALAVPIAYVSVISEDCQCMAAVLGAQLGETPREHSLCHRAVEAGQVVLCHDAMTDSSFASHPLVVQSPHVRSFVAHPIRSAEGQFIGALCVADKVARAWTQEQLQVLHDLAYGLEAVVALRFLAGSHGLALGRVADLARAANTDGLTQLLNRRGITDMAHHAYARCHLEGRGFGLALIDLDHFKRVNDTYGHDAGDAALVETATRLRHAVRGEDIAGRWGGEEFIAVLPTVGFSEMAALGERLVAALAGPVEHAGVRFDLTASVGLAWDPASEQRFDLGRLIRQADAALYRAKDSGRNRAVVDGCHQAPIDRPPEHFPHCSHHS
jgi:diguanylate cyclase (GGDEF)-like protein